MILREMQAGEERGLQFLALKSFWRSLESPVVSRPKTAMVAEKDGKIIGGFLYSIENSGKNKLGFIDFFFVDSAHAGQGVGGALCKNGVAHMWAQGCDYLMTFVRDDNVGSWAAFEKSGFTRVGLPEFTRAVGIGGLIRTNINHAYGLSMGCNLYFATQNETTSVAHTKGFGFGQLILHFIVSTVLVLVAGLFAIPDFLSELPRLILSVAIVFGGVMLFTYIGTLFSRRGWKYQMTTGGGMLSLIAPLLGVFIPIAGGFCPEKYENTAKFRRDMAMTAILPWVFLIALMPILRSFDFAFLHSGIMTNIALILLIFRCVPWHSANLGSSRIFHWNLILWILMVVATLVVLFIF